MNRCVCTLMAVLLILIYGLVGPREAMAETFVDAVGRHVRINGPPKRIVSLAPSVTEILYYLGLGDRIVGVTMFSDFPRDALAKPRVGSYAHLNVERILELEPDLAVGTKDGNEPNAVALLEQAGLPVYIVNPRHVEDVADTLFSVARLCRVEEKGKRLAESLTSRIKAVKEAVKNLPKPSVFIQINIKPIISVSRHTIHNDVIRLAGGRNVMEDASVTYPTVSVEELLARKPEVIIISSMERGGRFEKAKREWMIWKSIPAVRNNRVYLVNSDILDRPSPRIIDGLETVARLLHPEIGRNQRTE
ncbi:MAG: cobalamin-binding protein [Deltaproteobacteria bacterium]|nr:MAG: cobalamin-binding protein [Deltaproteobacteria bacterium]